MGYDDDQSIPPGPRRRRHDMSPKLALLVLLGSTPVSLPTIWATGSYLYRAQTAIERIAPLEKAVAEAKEQQAAQQAELERLRRWQCILGYDPGGVLGQATILPRDRRGECRSGQRERETP